MAQGDLRESEISTALLMPIVVVETALVTDTGDTEIPPDKRALPEKVVAIRPGNTETVSWEVRPYLGPGEPP